MGSWRCPPRRQQRHGLACKQAAGLVPARLTPQARWTRSYREVSQILPFPRRGNLH